MEKKLNTLLSIVEMVTTASTIPVLMFMLLGMLFPVYTEDGDVVSVIFSTKYGLYLLGAAGLLLIASILIRRDALGAGLCGASVSMVCMAAYGEYPLGLIGNLEYYPARFGVLAGYLTVIMILSPLIARTVFKKYSVQLGVMALVPYTAYSGVVALLNNQSVYASLYQLLSRYYLQTANLLIICAGLLFVLIGSYTRSLAAARGMIFGGIICLLIPLLHGALRVLFGLLLV